MRWRFMFERGLPRIGESIGCIEIIQADSLFDAWYVFMLYTTNDDGEDYLLQKHGCTDVKELKSYLTIDEIEKTINVFDKELIVKRVTEID